MIMFFADPHLGHHLYHKLSTNNITTAEEDIRHALNQLVVRASQDDIDFMICAGDFFNRSQPSAESIRFTIEWLQKMDKVGKPLYIMPGNHDVTTFSHSIVFLRSLNVTNIFLVENDISKILWGDWNIYFIPFMNPKSSHNKYSTTLDALAKTMNAMDRSANNMIVTHIQEAKSTIGSENFMFSKPAEVVNLDECPPFRNTLFLAGHMHAHQTYTKTSGIKVVYPGSLTYLEKPDCNMDKGYVTISYDGSVKFETIQGIRVFKKYKIPQGTDPLEFLNSTELVDNSVVFLDIDEDVAVDTKEVSTLLGKHGCILGKITVIGQEKEKQSAVITTQSRNPNQLLENHLAIKFADEETSDWRRTILPLGKEILIHED